MFRYAEDKRWDILLLDIEMPGMDGVTMARRIRKENETVQIVFITGYSEYISEGYEVAALHYLMKPVDKDKLFATLDPTTRQFELPAGTKLLLTDTVGFIRNLPHHLIKAFKSTLDEAVYSDILLIVIDSSDPEFIAQTQVTSELLEELGAAGKPTIYVFNKCDICADRDALIEGILDGTIDMIATDHAPHSAEEKGKGLAKSAMGVVGIETAFPLMYTYFVETGRMSLEMLIDRMAYAPRKRFRLDGGINVGDRAEITVFDLNTEYTIDPADFLSKGKATPFEGWKVHGECKLTICGENVAYENID